MLFFLPGVGRTFIFISTNMLSLRLRFSNPNSSITAFGKILRGTVMYSNYSIGVCRQKLLRSIPMNFAFGVKITLLNNSLAVTILSLGVYVLPGQSMWLPYTVHHIMYESSCIGKNAATARRYVDFWLCRMVWGCLNLIVSVPSNRWISLPFPLIHFCVSLPFIKC